MASEIERQILKKVIGKRFIDSFRVFEKLSGHWSWWDYRNKSFELNKGWRIDHIYISNNLLSNLKSSVIERSQREKNQIECLDICVLLSYLECVDICVCH